MEQGIRDYLIELADKNNGRLTPEQVVDDATNPQSPLHEEFEWDDAEAAKLHRLNQARSIIRRVQFVEHGREVSFHRPVFIHDPDLPAKEAGYIQVSSLLTDREKSARALAQEVARVDSSLKRAREIAFSLDLTETIDAYIQQWAEVRAQVSLVAGAA